jgi:DNA-binding NarL/FixJ family response regulator
MNGTLSERELSVVRLVAQGRTNQEIGEGLGIATSTVKAHLVRIGLKLRVHNRAELAYWAAKKRVLTGKSGALHEEESTIPMDENGTRIA